MNSEEIFNNIKNQNRKTVRAEFDTQEFLKSIGLDKKQNIGNVADQKIEPQYVDVDKPKFVQPQQRSYFVAGNVANNEINTTAQRPNEIEYEADVVDDEKKKDNYFGLSKLATNKKDIVKNALKYVVQAPNLIQNAANTIGMFTGKSGEDVIKEGVRGFAGSTVDFASAMTRFFGQNYMYFKAYKDEQIDKITNLGNVVVGGEDLTPEIKQKYTDFYKKIDEQTREFIGKTERFMQDYGIAKTDKDGFIYDLVGGTSSLMYAIGLSVITKSPAAAAEVFGAYQYQSLYEEAIENGFNPLKARTIGVVGGVAEGALELVGLHVLIETLAARKSFAKILKSAVTEFIQEASQQGAEELLAKFSGMREETLKDALFNVGYAGLIGALIGGGVAGISNTRFVRKMISDSATKELINIGVKDGYAKQMVNNMLNFSVSPQVADELNSMLKDEQSPVTYKNADPRETYKEFGDTVKKALDPAQKRGVELELIQANKKLTQELANVLLNSGKAKNSDEAYRMAEQQTAMYDVLAREAYNQEGIRPEDYYKRFNVNAQSGDIETDERNVDDNNISLDDSFNPIDFDETERTKYEAEIEGYEDWLADEQKRSGIKNNFETQKNILADMGIGKIRKLDKSNDRYGEYEALSPRIKSSFFTDVPTAMTWDEAEHILQQHNGDSADIFDYFDTIDKSVPVGQEGYLQKGIFNKVLAKEKEAIKQQAVADGTFMKAPNGKDSNLPEQLWLTVRTKAFKNWFGDWLNDPANASKVVDENGEPLVVYHGTKADFSVFEGQRIANTSEGAGFYFTPNKNLAQGFGNVKAVFLNIRNPQYAYGNIDLVSDTYEEDYEKENKEAIDKGLQEVKKKLEKKGYKFYKQVQKDLFDVIGTQTQEVLDGLLYLRNFVENENFDEEKIYNDIREAEKEVFKVDGYTTNRYGGDQKVYVAFTSNQIKSINNRGSFDRNNPDIYYQAVYHGTPHRFDTFSTEKIGTGEGAQAHGWGLYFAADKGVSERYRQALNNTSDIKFVLNGKDVDDNTEKLLKRFEANQIPISFRDSKNLKETIKKGLELYENDIKDLKEKIKISDKFLKELPNKITSFMYEDIVEKIPSKIKDYIVPDLSFLKRNGLNFTEEDVVETIEKAKRYFEGKIEKYSDIVQKVKKIDLDNLKIKEQVGQLFKVDIPDSNVLLDEDKLFDEQPKKVQEAILKIGKDLNISDLQFETKNDFLKKVENKFGKKARNIFEKIYDLELEREAKETRNKEVSQELENKIYKTWDEWNEFETENNIDRNEFDPNAIYKVINKSNMTGEAIYNNIAYHFLHSENYYGNEADKQASLILNKYGVKGISYNGGRDGRAFVIFDDKAVKILEKFYQEQQQEQPRGSTTIYDRQYFIDLFSASDKSTLLHETGHVFLSEILYFARSKNASKKVLEIKKKLDEWLGEPEDNGRYSTRQQELFATSAEAFFREGKAPTAKLKTVFERFKKWLSDIYDRIKDDLPKINDDIRELFNTILSRSYDVPDSNIYAGKESAIKEVVKNIQEGRASEVDGITIDDVYNLLNVAYTRKPSRPSKNLKQLLNDKNIYDFNELNKAGADTVLQILKDGGYVKEDATTEQAVELAKAALDGNPVYRLADQWRVAGDIDFARNLRVLEKVIEFSQIDSVMEKILTLQEEGYRNVEQGDVDKVQDEYKRLMSADVKEAKKVVEDIINRLHKKRFINRAAQKQMINDLKFSATVEEIQESVLNVIEDLQDEIKLVKEQLRNPRKPIVRKDKTIPPGKNATEEEKNNYKKYMRKQINRLLKQALPRKQNQQKFSKFDEQTQRFFTDLEKYNKMTIEQAQGELYQRATSIIDDEGVGLDNYEKMKNMFLSYKANKVNQNTTEFYKQLYDNLMQINVFGRNAKEIEETLKKEQIQKDINDLVVNIEDNKSKNGLTAGVKKQYIKWLGNWWSTINAIAGKKQADKDSLERIEIDIFNKNYETTENLKTKCAAALGLKNATDLDMTVNRYLNEEYTYEELDARSGTSNAVKLNKMQLICCYIWMKNDNLKERIVRAFGNVQIMDMMDKLTIQDKKFGDELQKAVASLYDDINKVYLKMYGLDMPQAENYFPSSVERIQGNMDLLKDNIGQVSSPGFIKARVQSNLPLMNFGNPVKIALDHITKVNHFIYMQEKLADLNKVYKTTVVKRHITNAYGDRVYKYILQVLDNAKFSTVARTIDGISDIGDYLVNNYVLTKIAIKPSIMIKQLLSCINYAEDMSSVKWFEGFLKGVTTPKKVIDFMMKNSKYCQSRFAKGGQTEALLKAMEGSNATFAKVKTFKGMLSWMTRVGDIGAIIFGGYPYVVDQMSKGVSLKTAIENFERATIRSQQASLPSTLSNFQYRGMNSWLYRAMFAFANTPNQYSRKIGDTIYMYFHGDINKKQAAKNLLIYGVLNSFLYTSFTSLAILSGLVSGDWDDLKDDIIMSLMQCSNVLALPIISQAYNSFVSKVVTGDFAPDKEIPLLDDMVKIMRTATKDELEFKDWLTIIDEVSSLVLGVPVKTLYNEFVGSTKDLLDGEYGKFAVKLYGATESRANKIFDN